MIRKLIARSLVMMLLVAALPIAPKKEVQAAGAETILAHFTFDNAEEGFRSEGAVATPGKEGVEMKFSDDIAFSSGTGKSLSFDGTENTGWLEVTKTDGTPLLTGKDTFAISYYSKPRATDAQYYGWTYNIRRALSEGNWNLDGESGDYHHNLYYIGITDRPDGALNVERFFDTRTESFAIDMDKEKWKHVLVQYEPTRTTVYINGIQAAQTPEEEVRETISATLLDNSNFKIGAADWGWYGKECYSGLMDEFTVFDGKVSEETIAALAAASARELKGLQITAADNADRVKVGGNLQLTAVPTPEDVWDAPVTWSSSDEKIASVSADGRLTGKGEGTVEITVTSVDKPSIKATKTITVYQTYTVRYLKEKGGTIVGSATQEVLKGQSAEPVRARANAGYIFTGWSDGVATEERQDKNVQANMSVTAKFKLDTVKLAYLASEGGKVRHWDEEYAADRVEMDITRGKDGTEVVAVPDSGYTFVKWSDDVTTAERTDLAVMKDLEVTALFAKVVDNVTVNYLASPGGRIQGKAQQEIERGQNAEKVTAVADAGYRFVQWSDGLKTADRADAAVSNDLTVTAVFEKVKPGVASVKLNVKKATLGAKEKFKLIATVAPAGTGAGIKWSVNKSSIAAVNQKGEVTAKKPGKAIVTAEAGGKTYKCTVTVKKAPTAKTFKLNAKKKTLAKGKIFRIKPKFIKKTYSNKITYKSSNKRVAAVTKKGVVKAVRKGTAKITVTTFNKKKVKLTITVK